LFRALGISEKCSWVIKVFTLPGNKRLSKYEP
jgi:hypothetical protein